MGQPHGGQHRIRVIIDEKAYQKIGGGIENKYRFEIGLVLHYRTCLACLSIYLSIGINVRFAAMMADVGDGLL